MILAIGDSFTYGAELQDPASSSWPAVLEQLLNQPVVNLGLTGSSNDRITRLAVENSGKYDLIICAWSDVSRLEVPYHNELLQLNLNDKTLTVTFPWLKDYLADHYKQDYSSEKWIMTVLMLQSFLLQKKQPFLFVNAIPKILNNNLYDLWEQVDNDLFLEKDSSMMDWCKSVPIGPNGHFLEQGHELVAERLASYIKDNSLNLHDGGYPVCNKIHRRPRSSCDATHI